MTLWFVWGVTRSCGGDGILWGCCGGEGVGCCGVWMGGCGGSVGGSSGNDGRLEMDEEELQVGLFFIVRFRWKRRN